MHGRSCFYIIWTGVVIIFGCFVAAKAENVTVVVLIERSTSTDFHFSINRTRGLISIAVNHTKDMLLGEANMHYVIQPVDVVACVATKWGGIFAELYHMYKPHAVIGPGCTPAVQTVSLMAAYWDLPHITYVGADETLGYKQVFSTLTRTGISADVVTIFYVKMLEVFGYTFVANIYDTAEYIHNLFGTSLQEMFRWNARQIHSLPVPFNSTATDLTAELLNAVRRASSRARVFLVFCHGDVFRKMVLVTKQTSLKVGEYVYIFMYGGQDVLLYGTYSWYRGDSFDEEALRDYESVLVSRIKRPTSEDFLDFERQVKERALIEYNYTWPEGHEVEITQIAMYDAFMLYANVLHETLAAGEDPHNGTAMVDRMWNRTFESISGTVFINENGDRDVDFGLRDLNPATGEFELVGEYLGWKRKFEFIKGTAIHWPGTGKSPDNVPPCGFMGELCPPQSKITIVSIGNKSLIL